MSPIPWTEQVRTRVAIASWRCPFPLALLCLILLWPWTPAPLPLRAGKVQR